jgi:hypothetical protein
MTLKIERDLHNTSKATLARLIKRLAKKKYTPTSSVPPIPAPALFDSLFAPQPPGSSTDVALPSVAECAAHLEFLECLFTLRQRVLQSAVLDAVFGIQEHHRTVTRKGKTVKLKDATLWDRRQAKWKSFVEWSVARFLLWRRNVHVWCPPGQAWSFTEQTLPPLDVLMVLHALLLNPARFRRHCGLGPLREVRFPWALVHRAANSGGGWEFSLSTEATARCAEWLGMNADLLEDMQGWGRDAEIRKPLIDFAHDADAPYPRVPVRWSTPPGKPGMFHPPERALGAQLSAAVMRQCGFIDKMDGKLWIRSPAAEDTLTRAGARYEQFLKLMKLYPDVTLVPTLDIDLVWHTHQCSPARYVQATRQLVGKFVNHDDTIAKDKLDTGFDKTRALYLMRFGKEYRVCGCWDCEALLSALHVSGARQVPDEEALQKVSDQVTYYKTVEAARRQKLPLPDRALWASVHGKKG